MDRWMNEVVCSILTFLAHYFYFSGIMQTLDAPSLSLPLYISPSPCCPATSAMFLLHHHQPLQKGFTSTMGILGYCHLTGGGCKQGCGGRKNRYASVPYTEDGNCQIPPSATLVPELNEYMLLCLSLMFLNPLEFLISNQSLSSLAHRNLS